MNNHDTIAALATPVGIGGIGVIKISGPFSRKAAERIFKAVETVYSVRKISTPDLGGTATTQSFADAIIKEL